MDNRILDQVRNPASYLGCEWGAVRKPLSGGILRWALAFPDAYEIGMSHLGLQILYHILNRNPESAAERVFTPRLDMQGLLAQTGAPLLSLETQTPLNEFDIVGFSLLYELGYTNVLKMLQLGKIPVRASERSDRDPLIIAGGPCVTNPEPLRPFFDAFVLGEGEDVVMEINSAIREIKVAMRRAAPPRDALLKRLAQIEGVYVPAIHNLSKTSPLTPNPSPPGRGEEFNDRNDAAFLFPSPCGRGVRGEGAFEIQARKVADLDLAPFPTNPVVPTTEAIHDRAVVEIARGCPHACRFCHAGYLGRPHRERKPATVWRLANVILANTGHQDLTLLSLSTGDYSCLPQLVEALSARFGRCGVAISLPSLRADSLSSKVVEGIRGMRKTGVTIAPEAGSARMRAVINKDISEEEALRTARLVFDNGWDLIKLYFMFGLPTETDEDMHEIARLVKNVRREGLNARIRPRINVSLSAFVPKPHTPFQWEAMLTESEIDDRLGMLKGLLRIPGVNLKWSPPFMSVLEGVFARGDARLAPVIEKAVSLGAAFDAWGESFKPEIWKQAFADEGLDPAEFASRRRSLDEPLPWGHLKTGVSTEWLAAERDRAISGARTMGCEDFPCPDPCGACDDDVAPIRFDKAQIEVSEPCADKPREDFIRVRLTWSKTGPARYLGHLDTMRQLTRSLRRAKLDVLYSEGFHPKPRVSFGDALPLGVESYAEMVDVWVLKTQAAEKIPENLNKALPDGFKILSAREITASAPAIEAAVKSARFRFDAGASSEEDRAKKEETIRRFNEAAEFWVEKESRPSIKRVNIKSAVTQITIIGDGAIEIEFAGGKDRVRPRLAYEALFGPLPPGAKITKVAIALND